MAGQLDDSDDNENEDIHQQVVYLLGEAGQVDIHHLFNLDPGQVILLLPQALQLQRRRHQIQMIMAYGK